MLWAGLLYSGLALAAPRVRWTDQWCNKTLDTAQHDVASSLLSASAHRAALTNVSTACRSDIVVVRTEFRSMHRRQRKAFTDAITCLQRMPAENELYPGVKSRYDEYVATHINYTFSIHQTASFFAWHRFFIHALEQDLRRHCRYKGNLPYWDWQIDADAPQHSELFNGDAYSMGSNGAYIANRSDTFLGLQDVTFPPGTGGGCVPRGPFSNYTVNLGPLDSPYGGNVRSPFDHNPRCLVRDFNPWFSRRYNTYDNVTDLLMNYNTIADFQARIQGYYSTADRFGAHGGGHWLAGGPATMADFHSSPADPLFFLHHGMIDRLWYIWQNMAPERQDALSGTSTLGNNPPSKEMTLNDTIPFGLVAPDQRLGDLMSTISGPFCYRYD